MARKLKPAIELLSNIGSLGFDLQHHSDADIAEAMAFMRQANGPMFDYLAERLAPPHGDATPPQQEKPLRWQLARLVRELHKAGWQRLAATISEEGTAQGLFHPPTIEEAAAPGDATPPQLGKGVDPNYFMTLAAMSRTTDDWIVLTFHEGGTIRVPIHPDNVAVLVEPERH